jgi:hypothetical protein
MRMHCMMLLALVLRKLAHDTCNSSEKNTKKLQWQLMLWYRLENEIKSTDVVSSHVLLDMSKAGFLNVKNELQSVTSGLHEMEELSVLFHSLIV